MIGDEAVILSSLVLSSADIKPDDNSVASLKLLPTLFQLVPFQV